MKSIRCIIGCILLVIIVLISSGCASNLYPGGPSVAGLIYTEVTTPAQMLTVAVDKDAQPFRKGEASSVAILGLFAFGNGGIDAAMKDAGITKVHHVDHTTQHFLYAIFAKDKVVVHGE
jgi:hypothetical protein